MKTKHSRIAVAFLVLTISVAAAAQATGQGETAADNKKRPDVIFVPTQQTVVEAMLDLAKVNENDVLYDLGCGDGRIVVTAAQKYGARAVGIDIDPERIRESNENARKAGVTSKVEFRQADLFKSDFSEASVVTLYLLSTLNEKLHPILMKQLKPGTRIVSHDFPMGDWKPEKTITVDAEDRQHTVHLWVVPQRSAKK